MKLAGKRVLITGGLGFIGSHLCERLVEANRVTVYDSGLRDALRFTSLEDHPHLRLVRGDIRDRARLLDGAREAQVFIHLAAVAGVSNYYVRPVDTMTTNVVGTSVVLDVAREVQPERLLNFSTSEVYGAHAPDAREQDVTHQGEVKVSRWSYSVSKLAAEHLCFAYHRQLGLPVVSVRPFNVYGPRQVGEGAVQIFANQALCDEPITLHNDGEQVRAWCYIDDLLDGVDACLVRPEAVGEVFNLGNPEAATTTRGLAEKIVSLTGARSEVRFATHEPAGDVRLRRPNIDKARRILGFEPKVPLEEGLRRTIDWYRMRGHDPNPS
jgi:UDP-glucose 4-epimerase